MKAQLDYCARCQKPVDVRDRDTLIGFRGIDPQYMDEVDIRAAYEVARKRPKPKKRMERDGYEMLASVVGMAWGIDEDALRRQSRNERIVMGMAMEELGAILTAVHPQCAAQGIHI